ncbi:MAG TPA: hypothetical protein VL309_10045 [Vicinamibacterales bacterium]|nr:hypothetical protein [Vicinamibacterales bacterium]
MKTRQLLALGLAVAFTGATMSATLDAVAQQTATLGGTAKKEAKKPYTDYTVRIRNVQQGQVAGTLPLDTDAKFTVPNLPPAQYVVELLNHDGKVVCTEGPFDMTHQLIKDDVDISCNHVPAAWWLVGAAAAAGITAGVLSASPSR